MVQKRGMGPLNISEKEFAWFFNEVKNAIAEIKNFGSKTNEEVNGEIYTSLRRALIYEMNNNNRNFPKDACILFMKNKKIFKSKFYYTLTLEQRKRLEIMFNSLMQRRMSEIMDETNEENLIGNMQCRLTETMAIINRMKVIAGESEKVRNGLNNIQNILDGKEEEA